MFKPGLIRRLRTVLAVLAVTGLSGQSTLTAYAGALDLTPFSRLPAPQHAEPPKDPALEDLFPRSELSTAPVTPYALEGTKIPGLTDKSIRRLGLNNFVIVVNEQFRTLADVYRDNRLRGKPNFITADSIVHPYVAFTNGVTASVIAKLAPQLQALLTGMFNSAAAQYRAAQDASLRGDTERNCAFLVVAIKLLNPAVEIAPIGNANSIATKELQNIAALKIAESAVFARPEDFSLYRPLGWFCASPQFSNFYRCHAWLSHMYFTLSDEAASSDSSTSEFRRSLLLFQNLQLAKANGEAGLAVWNRIVTALDTVGTANSRDHLFLPTQYETLFSSGQTVSLNALSEPFYRTKLLLLVRRQHPLEVGSASIFNTALQKSSAETSVVFRLFPLTDDVELAWMQKRAHEYSPESTGGPVTPLALFDLYAHGAAQASNLLAENTWHMDQSLANLLPELVRQIKAAESPPGYSLGQARWQLFSLYFKPFAEGAQPALRATMWLNARLESAFAAWVDGHLSVAPVDTLVPAPAGISPPSSTVIAQVGKPASTGPAATPVSITTTDALAAAAAAVPPPAAVPPADFNYLEPCPDLYRKIAADAEQFSQVLTTQKLLSKEAGDRFLAFETLAKRLAAIADRELAYKPVYPADMSLLANIDQALDKVSFPLQGTLPLNTGDGGEGGCNLGLGRAGYLHVLCHTTKGVMLCRGATYTYYEIPGGPIKPEHWERKLQFGMVHPPEWTTEYEVVQNAPPVRATN